MGLSLLSRFSFKFVFLTWAFCLLVWAINLPPFFAPDETTHATWVSRFLTNQDPWSKTPNCSDWEKSIHVGEFEKIMRNGQGQIPSSSHLNINNIQVEECKKVHSSGSYSRLVFYFPFFLGFHYPGDWKAKFQLGRVFNVLVLIVFAALICFPSNVLPDVSPMFTAGRLAFLLVSLLPLSLQQSVALSMDFPLIIGCWAIFGLLNFSAHSRLFRVFLLGGVFWASAAKPVFLPLSFIPATFFYLNKRPKEFRAMSLVGWVCLAPSLLRAFLFFLGSETFDPRGPAAPNASNQTNLNYLVQNPLHVAWVVLTGSWGKIAALPGTRLGWLNIPLSKTHTILGHLSFFIFLLALNTKRLWRFRWSLFSSGFFVCLFIWLTGLSLYLGFSPVGANQIFGLQTRYFIPVWFIGLTLLSQVGLRDSQKMQNAVNAIIGIAGLLNTLFVMFQILKLFPTV